tara:strand:+ start:9251 stop:9418 length:168 start_codon:yes stop_codon:yes gene_type:complete
VRILNGKAISEEEFQELKAAKAPSKPKPEPKPEPKPKRVPKLAKRAKESSEPAAG